MNKKILLGKYLNNEIDIFGLVRFYDSFTGKNVKETGIVYTPKYIVDFMIKNALINLHSKIIEPSCGHGIFVFAILEYFKNNLKLSGNSLFEHFLKKVVAIDIEEGTISELKELLCIYFQKEGVLTNKDCFLNIINVDSLKYISTEKFDICIGNPPYVRIRNIEPDYLKFLRETFVTCKKGNIDLYYAFIEKYFKLSKKLCFITPNSFLTNKSGYDVRKVLEENLCILIDFKERLIFDNAQTYTSIFMTGEKHSSDYSYSEDIIGNYINIIKKTGDFLNINSSVLNKNISNNYKVLSGIATLRDNIYKVLSNNDGTFFAIFEGQKYSIESDFVIPFHKLTKIKNGKEQFIIFPYDNDMLIIAENTLKQRCPNLYKYLTVVKKELDLRDKGKVDNYDSWYAYGRKQGFGKFLNETLVIIPQMIGGRCLPIEISTKDLKKGYKMFLFTSGFIIDTDKKAVRDYFMSKSFIDNVKIIGVPYPGKDEPYYTISATQLKKMF